MSKVTAIATYQEQSPFSPQHLEILKNSICKGISDEEFQVFIMACVKTQLDPFMRQIYAVPRKTRRADGSYVQSMTIQTGIDGYRLIAERTERYAPGPEPTYSYNQNGELLCATAHIKKLTKDGTWHIVSSSAYIDEYCQTFVDRSTGEKKPMGMWATMPKTMLAKCAEAQALRRAFPSEMSGVYTKEEMQQADAEELITPITLEQASELEILIGDCSKRYRDSLYEAMKREYKVEELYKLPAECYEKIKGCIVRHISKEYERNQKTQLLLAEVQ